MLYKNLLYYCAYFNIYTDCNAHSSSSAAETNSRFISYKIMTYDAIGCFSSAKNKT